MFDWHSLACVFLIWANQNTKTNENEQISRFFLIMWLLIFLLPFLITFIRTYKIPFYFSWAKLLILIQVDWGLI